jgi:hypothetical protein
MPNVLKPEITRHRGFLFRFVTAAGNKQVISSKEVEKSPLMRTFLRLRSNDRWWWENEKCVWANVVLNITYTNLKHYRQVGQGCPSFHLYMSWKRHVSGMRKSRRVFQCFEHRTQNPPPFDIILTSCISVKHTRARAHARMHTRTHTYILSLLF